MEILYRFLLGGLIVTLFSLVGDVLRPKGFAGLFGAAPSVALATLSLTIFMQGKDYAALEGRSMIVGACALFFYALACLYLLSQKHLRVVISTLLALPVWAVCAFGIWALVLR